MLNELDKISKALDTYNDLSLIDFELPDAQLVSNNFDTLLKSPETSARNLSVHLYLGVFNRLGDVCRLYPKSKSGDETALSMLDSIGERVGEVRRGDFVAPTQRVIVGLGGRSGFTLQGLLTRAPELVKTFTLKRARPRVDNEAVYDEAIAQCQADCMFAIIKDSGDERTVRRAVKAIAHLHDTMGADFTKSDEEVEEAIRSTLDIINPVKIDILRFLNLALVSN